MTDAAFDDQFDGRLGGDFSAEEELLRGLMQPPRLSGAFRQRVLDAGRNARRERSQNRRVLGISAAVACLMTSAVWSYPQQVSERAAQHLAGRVPHFAGRVRGPRNEVFGNQTAAAAGLATPESETTVALNQFSEWDFVDMATRKRAHDSRIIQNVFSRRSDV